MPADPNNPFLFEADLDTSKLKVATSRADKYYAMFSKSVTTIADKMQSAEDKITAGFKKGLAAHKRRASDAKNVIQRLFAFRQNKAKEEKKDEDEAGKEKKKQQGMLSKWFSGEKSALQEIGISWRNLKSMIGGAVLVGFIYKATTAFLDFDKSMREINTTFGDQPLLMAEANRSVTNYAGYLNATGEELIAINRALGEHHLIHGNTKKAAKQYRGLALDVIHLSKAMEVSGDSVVYMFSQFRRVYKLPHHRLRNIAASVKYIQEQTSITGDELMSFAQSLDDVLSRMTSVSRDAKGEVIADMMAMAGALKDMGVQPEKMATMFSESLKIHSQQGAQFLSFIVQGTGRSIAQVRQMIKEGNVETPLTMLIDRLKREGPEWLAQNEHWVTEATGATFAELTNLRASDEKTRKELFAKNRKAYKEGKRHEEAAMQRQARLSRVWATIKRTFENTMINIGEVISKVAERMIDPMTKIFERGTKYVTSFISTLDVAAASKAILKWFETFIGHLKATYVWIKESLVPWITKRLIPAFKWMGEKIGEVVEWWDSLSNSTKNLMLGSTGMIILFGKFAGVLGGISSNVLGVVAGITAVYVGAKKISDWVDEHQTQAMKGEALRKETEGSMMLAIKGTKQEKIGFLKQQMASKTGMLTASGAVKDTELWKRAYQVLPMSTTETMGGMWMTGRDRDRVEQRKSMVAQWKGVLTAIANKSDVSVATKSLEAQRATVPAEAPTVSKVTVPNASRATAPAPTVHVSADSPTSEKLLAEIRDVLMRIGRVGNAHPSRAEVNGVLG
jgi:hypothetical protein